MSKLFMVVSLTIAVAAGGYFFLVVDQGPQPEDTYVPQVEKHGSATEEASDAVTEEVTPEVPVAPVVEVPQEGTPSTDPAPVVEDAGADVDETLTELDSLFDDEYDDSDLDASFEDNLDQSYGF